MVRQINTIVIHCSATPEGRDVKVEDINRWHLDRGWSSIGYHYVIELDGSVKKGRPIEKAGAHARGYNANSIGICYVGGMNKQYTEPKDTRTKEQNASLVKLVFELKAKYNIDNSHIIGHNQISPKACPSFDVKQWLEELRWE